MNNRRDWWTNLLAEVIARAMIGFGVAAFVFVLEGPRVLRWQAWRFYDHDFHLVSGLGLWEFLAICGAAGIVGAIFGTRNGPGAI